MQLHFRAYPVEVLTVCEDDAVKWNFVNALKEVQDHFLFVVLFFLFCFALLCFVFSLSFFLFCAVCLCLDPL